MFQLFFENKTETLSASVTVYTVKMVICAWGPVLITRCKISQFYLDSNKQYNKLFLKKTH